MEGQQKGSKSKYTFPPGFRFHPSDEELIVHYLQNKIKSRPLPASIIAEIDLYKYNPWELPSMFLTPFTLCILSIYQILFIIMNMFFIFLVIVQRSLCLVRKNGISLVRETESIRMV